MKVLKSLTKTIATALATIVFVTNVALVHATETNLWSERRKNAAVQMARLPVLPVSQIPSISKNLPQRTVPKQFPDQHKSLLTLPEQVGTIRKIITPANKTTNKVVVHIQDIHQNPEAQKNIGEAVKELIKNKSVGVVGLEGASGDIDLKRFQTFPDQNAIRMVANYLLRENQISGPVQTALLQGSINTTLTGIDDPTHYQANVEAYRQAAPLQKKLSEEIKETTKTLAEKKANAFNSALIGFDSHVQKYRTNSSSLADYVEVLASRSTQRPAMLTSFQKALVLEDALNFTRVEQERSSLLSNLLPKLATAESNSLIQHSLAFKSGRLRQTDFYNHLSTLCEKNDVALTRYPEFKKFLNYILIADTIDAEQLFRDMTKIESTIYNTLTKTDQENSLIEQSRYLHLAGKLVEFSLTREEWVEYSKALHSPWSMDHRLSLFESFYKEAILRDQKMADNLLQAMSRSNSSAAVLVTGGFHSSGITEALTKAGVTTVTFVPKISKVDTENGTHYLTAFTQERSPLEKLAQGEKLFLALPPAKGLEITGPALITAADPARAQETLQTFAPNSALRAKPDPKNKNAVVFTNPKTKLALRISLETNFKEITRVLNENVDVPVYSAFWTALSWSTLYTLGIKLSWSQTGIIFLMILTILSFFRNNGIHLPYTINILETVTVGGRRIPVALKVNSRGWFRDPNYLANRRKRSGQGRSSQERTGPDIKPASPSTSAPHRLERTSLVDGLFSDGFFTQSQIEKILSSRRTSAEELKASLLDPKNQHALNTLTHIQSKSRGEGITVTNENIGPICAFFPIAFNLMSKHNSIPKFLNAILRTGNMNRHMAELLGWLPLFTPYLGEWTITASGESNPVNATEEFLYHLIDSATDSSELQNIYTALIVNADFWIDDVSAEFLEDFLNDIRNFKDRDSSLIELALHTMPWNRISPHLGEQYPNRIANMDFNALPNTNTTTSIGHHALESISVAAELLEHWRIVMDPNYRFSGKKAFGQWALVRVQGEALFLMKLIGQPTMVALKTTKTTDGRFQTVRGMVYTAPKTIFYRASKAAARRRTPGLTLVDLDTIAQLGPVGFVDRAPEATDPAQLTEYLNKLTRLSNKHSIPSYARQTPRTSKSTLSVAERLFKSLSSVPFVLGDDARAEKAAQDKLADPNFLAGVFEYTIAAQGNKANMGLSDYATFLETNSAEALGERKKLSDSIQDAYRFKSNNGTHFFRHVQRWQMDGYFKALIERKWREKPLGGKPQIFVRDLGCSTGEEAYSIALFLYVELRALYKQLNLERTGVSFETWVANNWDIQIDAFDRNIHNLIATKNGVYRNHPPTGAIPWTEHLGDQFSLADVAEIGDDTFQFKAFLRAWIRPRYINLQDPDQTSFGLIQKKYDLTAFLTVFVHLPLADGIRALEALLSSRGLQYPARILHSLEHKLSIDMVGPNAVLEHAFLENEMNRLAKAGPPFPSDMLLGHIFTYPNLAAQAYLKKHLSDPRLAEVREPIEAALGRIKIVSRSESEIHSPLLSLFHWPARWFIKWKGWENEKSSGFERIKAMFLLFFTDFLFSPGLEEWFFRYVLIGAWGWNPWIVALIFLAAHLPQNIYAAIQDAKAKESRSSKIRMFFYSLVFSTFIQTAGTALITGIYLWSGSTWASFGAHVWANFLINAFHHYAQDDGWFFPDALLSIRGFGVDKSGGSVKKGFERKDADAVLTRYGINPKNYVSRAKNKDQAFFNTIIQASSRDEAIDIIKLHTLIGIQLFPYIYNLVHLYLSVTEFLILLMGYQANTSSAGLVRWWPLIKPHLRKTDVKFELEVDDDIVVTTDHLIERMYTIQYDGMFQKLARFPVSWFDQINPRLQKKLLSDIQYHSQDYPLFHFLPWDAIPSALKRGRNSRLPKSFKSIPVVHNIFPIPDLEHKAGTCEKCRAGHWRTLMDSTNYDYGQAVIIRVKGKPLFSLKLVGEFESMVALETTRTADGHLATIQGVAYMSRDVVHKVKSLPREKQFQVVDIDTPIRITPLSWIEITDNEFDPEPWSKGKIKAFLKRLKALRAHRFSKSNPVPPPALFRSSPPHLSLLQGWAEGQILNRGWTGWKATAVRYGMAFVISPLWEEAVFRLIMIDIFGLNAWAVLILFFALHIRQTFSSSKAKALELASSRGPPTKVWVALWAGVIFTFILAMQLLGAALITGIYLDSFNYWSAVQVHAIFNILMFWLGIPGAYLSIGYIWNPSSQQTVMVTGGAGYIGSHTVKDLLNQGYRVIVIDDLSSGYEAAIDPRAIFIKMDFANKTEMTSLMRWHRVDAVIHLAASTSGRESMENPEKYMENNFRKGGFLLEAMKDAHVKNLVFASTAITYGDPEYTPIDENHPLNPTNPYATSKVLMERLIKNAQQEWGLSYIIFRYFNVLGSSEDGSLGDQQPRPQYLLPVLIRVAKSKKKETFHIMGTDAQTRDGSYQRDAVHVEDVAAANRMAVARLLKEPRQDTLNLGTGIGYTIREIVALVKRITGTDFSVIEAAGRRGDPKILLADPSQAKKKLGWEHRFDLEDIVRHAWRWWSRYPGGYKGVEWNREQIAKEIARYIKVQSEQVDAAARKEYRMLERRLSYISEQKLALLFSEKRKNFGKLNFSDNESVEITVLPNGNLQLYSSLDNKTVWLNSKSVEKLYPAFARIKKF